MTRRSSDNGHVALERGSVVKIKRKDRTRSPYVKVVSNPNEATHSFDCEGVDAKSGYGNRKQRRAKLAKLNK